MFLLTWCLVVITTGILSRKNIFQSSNLDTYYFNTDRGYLGKSVMARLSYNKFTFYFDRYLNNFFAGVDPNYFFFGGHPREVPGGNNDFKIDYWLIYLFIFGVYDQLLNKETRIVFVYGVTLLIVSWFSIDMLWWTLVPFLYLSILYPLRGIWKK